jgi:hypothetical protein
VSLAAGARAGQRQHVEQGRAAQGMRLAVVCERGADGARRQARQRREVERMGLRESELVLGHHLVERRIERAAVRAPDVAADRQQDRAPRRQRRRIGQAGQGARGEGRAEEFTFVHATILHPGICP